MNDQSEREAAVLDSQYRAGVRAGWNACMIEDRDKALRTFQRLTNYEAGSLPRAAAGSDEGAASMWMISYTNPSIPDFVFRESRLSQAAADNHADRYRKMGMVDVFVAPLYATPDPQRDDPLREEVRAVCPADAKDAAAFIRVKGKNIDWSEDCLFDTYGEAVASAQYYNDGDDEQPYSVAALFLHRSINEREVRAVAGELKDWAKDTSYWPSSNALLTLAARLEAAAGVRGHE